MPIDTKCPGCGRLLRVGDEHSGRQARCPACSTVYVVPKSPAAVQSVAVPSVGVAGPAVGANPFADQPRPLGPDSSVASTRAWMAPARTVVPDRGGLVLSLGILAWVVGCPVFSVAAWMLGASDLREMRYGRMDASGKGATQAGYFLGLIHGLLWIIVLVILMVVMVVGLAAGLA